jgi:hypothetical protein
MWEWEFSRGGIVGPNGGNEMVFRGGEGFGVAMTTI